MLDSALVADCGGSVAALFLSTNFDSTLVAHGNGAILLSRRRAFDSLGGCHQ